MRRSSGSGGLARKSVVTWVFSSRRFTRYSKLMCPRCAWPSAWPSPSGPLGRQRGLHRKRLATAPEAVTPQCTQLWRPEPDLVIGPRLVRDHLIRSYRRGPARSQRCSPARVLMPAHDGRSAHGLLYLVAVQDDGYQQEHCQPCLDVGLSAWELACHALATTVFAGEGLFASPVDNRLRPSQTVASCTQRARFMHETIRMQTTGTALLAAEWCSIMRLWTSVQDSRSAHGLL
jgi:hypothetical protein